jgi:hypothetical protein
MELLIDVSDDECDAVFEGMIVFALVDPVCVPVVADVDDLLMPFEQESVVVWGDDDVSGPSREKIVLRIPKIASRRFSIDEW